MIFEGWVGGRELKGVREMRKSILISWDSINEGFERVGILKKKKKNWKKVCMLEYRKRWREMRDEIEDVGRG